QSPYRFLLNTNQTKYFGIDVDYASSFDYQNSNVTYFNGEEIPFANEQFDAVICTEVLEHVEKFQQLIHEIHRTMKPGAVAIFTVPWSARYHYIPYDFYRYTPSALKNMFSTFSEVEINN